MDPWICCLFDCIPGCVDIAFGRSGKGCDGAALDLSGNRLYRFKISRGRDSKTCLDDIYLHTLQAFCDLNLFPQIHAASR